MQLRAAPIGVLTALVLLVAWAVSTSALLVPFPGPATLLLLLLAVTPAHELLHAVFYPGSGRSPHTILGFWPRALMFYAHYTNELPRDRLIAATLAPFLSLSIVPLAAASLLDFASPNLALLSIWNGLSSCGDLYGVHLLLTQVPRHAAVRNQGWRTWWIARDSASGPG
jgi:hypothetical protein